MPTESPSIAAGNASGPDRGSPWQHELARAYTQREALLTELGLASDSSNGQSASPPDPVSHFPLRVPRGFVKRMRRGDPDDPLLRQVLIDPAESSIVDGFGADPVGDVDSLRSPGLLHKYHGRALLLVTGACAIHCRYCFRREFPYASQALSKTSIDAACTVLSDDPSITEVILSGGDPLSVTNHRLGELIERLNRIGHLKRLRIHTRMPVVLPERVDAGLMQVLARSRVPIVLVIHANHANEIDDTVKAAVATLSTVCAQVLNQSVLLRRINDSADALVQLSEALMRAGVLPYYLHQLDKVTGTAHFAVSDELATTLIDAVAARLPGYLVPRLVREVAGEPAKQAIRRA